MKGLSIVADQKNNADQGNSFWAGAFHGHALSFFAGTSGWAFRIARDERAADQLWFGEPGSSWGRSGDWSCATLPPGHPYRVAHPDCAHTDCGGAIPDPVARALIEECVCAFAAGEPDDHEAHKAEVRERSIREGLVIEGLGGACPVQADGWIGGHPFFFRARHSSWSLEIAADPAGDPLDVRFHDAPGWLRDQPWSCAELPAGMERDPDCDHIHCAGWMPNLVARSLIEECARDYLAGVPSAPWREPEIVTAVRELEAALDRGELEIVELAHEPISVMGFRPTGRRAEAGGENPVVSKEEPGSQ